jgi:hypothetical protein
LKSLKLEFLFPADIISPIAFLSRIPSSSLQEIELTSIRTDAEATDWRTFAQLLSEPQFAQLRSVRLCVHGVDENKFKATLLDYGARDIVSIISAPNEFGFSQRYGPLPP